ncbi:hypothetical protein [Staphylococcus borealis]|uniref:hypothetical protein n=1 Tax=Staphylococcus borealis TaxID=2742203 RepID=UPI000E6997E0|nr:hypothetical protein [Staphylococcus borealis]MDY4022246.1 hypothetical protein [Staphylococcus borealis]RIO69442.1 hypothetical protein BUZ17_11640 [Staphylococcus borealis]
MKRTDFEEKVKKQLWFLNKKEKKQLHNSLAEYRQEVERQDGEIQTKQYRKPIHYANQFLKNNVFQQKEVASTTLLLLLISMVLIYAFLLGLFLTGFITSLTAVNYFINPQVSMPILNVVLILIGAILLAIVSLMLIKSVTAFFTKKLLEYKFNKSA